MGIGWFGVFEHPLQSALLPLHRMDLAFRRCLVVGPGHLVSLVVRYCGLRIAAVLCNYFQAWAGEKGSGLEGWNELVTCTELELQQHCGKARSAGKLKFTLNELI